MLEWAVVGGHDKVVKFVIDQCFTQSKTDRWQGAVVNALRRAVEKGLNHICSLLLHEFDITWQSDDLLSTAARHNNYNLVEILLKAGANVRTWNSNRDIYPLFYAAEHGNNDMCQLLLQAGANVNGSDLLPSVVPLSGAAGRGHLHTVKFLLNAGADAKKAKVGFPNRQDEIVAGHREILELLLQMGAKLADNVDHVLFNVVRAHPAKWLSILRAVGSYRQNNPGPWEALLKFGVDVKHPAVEGVFVELFKWQHSDDRIIPALLDAGVNVHAGGDMALEMAIRNGQTYLVKLLMKAGADQRARDGAIIRAVDQFADKGFSGSILEMLEALGKLTEDLAMRGIRRQLDSEMEKGIPRVEMIVYRVGSYLCQVREKCGPFSKKGLEMVVDAFDRLLDMGADAHRIVDRMIWMRDERWVGGQLGKIEGVHGWDDLMMKLADDGANVDVLETEPRFWTQQAMLCFREEERRLRVEEEDRRLRALQEQEQEDLKALRELVSVPTKAVADNRNVMEKGFQNGRDFAVDRVPMYQSEIQQMMYVFGEVQEPLEETTLLVEEIVRTQMIEIIIQSVAQAAKRGSRYLSAEDVIFLIRHDRLKVNRMRSYLSWKDMRKRAKENDGTGTADAEELLAEETQETGGADKQGKASKKMKVKFSWDVLTAYSSVLEEDEDDDIDEEDQQAYEDQINRLRMADEHTRTMTKDEYIYYSECRQASFTYKKAKRFRGWCLMSTYYDNKPPGDVMDILGFLGYEMVSKLTETALEVKKEQDRMDKRAKAQEEQGGNTVLQNMEHLFSKPNHGQTPLEPRHIHEAFRRLQSKSPPMSNFRGGLVRTGLSLI
ncbi:Transcription initiation protein spt3 [Rhizophlyctis rosea]|nr:Transcription initiation protein spt3 [Rhizophlyctis rosea]